MVDVPKNTLPQLLTFSQAAETLGLSRRSVSRLVHDERIPVAAYVNTRPRIEAGDLAAFIEAETARAVASKATA